MFFFFFNELYYEFPIQQAFKNICLDKMLPDGYFDMSKYIFARIKKEDMLSKLILANSKYSVLYKGSYPTKENAVNLWRETIYAQNEYINNEIELSLLESEAVVNWVYRSCRNAEERELFTKELFKNIKDLHNIRNKVTFSQGVVFNKEKVEIHFVSSIAKLNSILSSYGVVGTQMFFRGHANSNYNLLPSIMRKTNWKLNEREMYNELMINCPENFAKCHSHLEKLVEMQHYGLPTRLLDITRNPLVALYFACESQFDSYGEVVLISVDGSKIKYPQSDTVTILSSLPLFSFEKQTDFRDLAMDTTLDDDAFNRRIARLLHEVRLEKPAFHAEVNRNDLLDNFVVYALKNNNRIIKQDGAFILCGLLSHNNNLNKFRYKQKGKKVILLVDKKEKMLEQLDRFSINHATLFPEIECVSEYIKNKYS